MNELSPHAYAYMVQFEDNKNCFKVGSSKDPINRICQVSSQHGNTKPVIFGTTKRGIYTEREIQSNIQKYSNNTRAFYNDQQTPPGNYVGYPRSREHFLLDIIGLFYAIDAFNKYCDVLYSGTFKKIVFSEDMDIVKFVLKGWGGT